MKQQSYYPVSMAKPWGVKKEGAGEGEAFGLVFFLSHCRPSLKGTVQSLGCGHHGLGPHCDLTSPSSHLVSFLSLKCWGPQACILHIKLLCTIFSENSVCNREPSCDPALALTGCCWRDAKEVKASVRRFLLERIWSLRCFAVIDGEPGGGGRWTVPEALKEQVHLSLA